MGCSLLLSPIVCVPERFSEEKMKVMAALGADVIRTPDAEGMQGAISKAREIAARTPDPFIALQFENQANPEFHYETTAQEIYEQMQGQVDWSVKKPALRPTTPLGRSRVRPMPATPTTPRASVRDGWVGAWDRPVSPRCRQHHP